MNSEKYTNDKVFDIAEASVRGGLFLFAGNVFSTVITAFTSILIARFLGAVGYGLYSVALVAPSLLFIFIDLGVNPALIKYCAEFRVKEHSNRIASIIKSGFLFKTTLSFIFFLILFCFSDWFAAYGLRRPDIAFLVRIVSILIILQVVFNTARNIFVGLDKMEYSATASVLQAIVKLVVALALIFLGFGVLGAIIGHIAGYLVAGFISLLLVYSLYGKFRSKNVNSRFSADLKFMIKYGFPLYFSGLLMGFLSQFRMLSLAWFVSDFDIGNFRAASNFLSLITIVAIPVSTALFPAFSKFNFKEEKEEIERFFHYSLKYILLLLTPVALLVGIASRNLVLLVYGTDFISASSYITLLTITYFYSGISMVINNFLNGIGRTDITLKVNVVNFLTSLPLIYILTMLQGVLGLITSIIISSLAALIYALTIVTKKFNIKFNYPDISKIYLTTFLSGSIAFLFHRFLSFSYLIELILVSAIFTTSYLVLVPLLGAINRRDIEVFRSIFSRFKLITPFTDILLNFESWLLNYANKNNINPPKH